MRDSRDRLMNLLVGGLIGGVIGAIVAVNLVIHTGIEGGYEATVPEVFRQNLAIGVATVLILAAGPVMGIWLASRQRRRHRRPDTSKGPRSHERTNLDG